MNELIELLSSTPKGKISDLSKLCPLLRKHWEEFAGHDYGNMKGFKLEDRMKEVQWNPPCLTLSIVRHGQFVLGSKFGSKQKWTVNLETKTARSEEFQKVLLSPLQPKLNVMPIAEEICKLILSGKEDERLKWYDDGRVRINIGKIIPDKNTAAQTVSGRRKRFKKALSDILHKEGWVLGDKNICTRKTNNY